MVEQRTGGKTNQKLANKRSKISYRGTMNRELKFRVWNHTEGHWNGMRCKDFQSCGDLICLNGIYLIPESVSRNHTVQQYTGLKDKNGVEIYEGDIVKVYSEEFENENFTGKVIFDEGSFLTWINKNDIRGVWSGDNIEVVGNIMENPELLKQ